MITRQIPNALTCGNLLCGCLGIVALFETTLAAAYFIWAACIFDFLDGYAARLLKQSSPIGKELDSLADMVSFGVLPAMVMLEWMQAVQTTGSVASVAFLLAIFSALRLAKFNIDENQKESFIGLPTPANAIFISGLIFLPVSLRNIIFSNFWILFVITIGFSYLLICPLPIFALKFKNFRWKDNTLRFTFLLLSVFLIALLKAGAISFIILLYIGLSLLQHLSKVRTINA